MFGPPELATPQPWQGGHAAQNFTPGYQRGGQYEAEPQTSPLHQVDGQQSERNAETEGDHGDEIHSGAAHLIILRNNLTYRGVGDQVAEVGEVQQGDGGQQ